MNEGPGARRATGVSPFLWLNFVCLDAPLVAIAWQWLFARALNLRLTSPSVGALFFTAWLIYLADRLADTFSLDRDREMSLRHHFCARHRRAWIAAMISVAACDAWLLTRHLDPRIVRFGAWVAAFAAAYLLINYAAGRVWRVLPIKEVTIGSLFAAGTTTALLPQLRRIEGPLLLTLVLFGALCSFNCVCIAFWERELDTAQGRESIATTWPAAAKYLIAIAICIVASALLASRLSVPLAIVNSCVALSTLLLAALHALRASVTRDQRTALADLVLLTPLLVLAIIR